MNIITANKLLYTPAALKFMKETGHQYQDIMQTDVSGMAKHIDAVMDRLLGTVVATVNLSAPKGTDVNKQEAACKMLLVMLSGFVGATVFSKVATLITPDNVEQIVDTIVKNPDMKHAIINTHVPATVDLKN